jgi:hypothetical protein
MIKFSTSDEQILSRIGLLLDENHRAVATRRANCIAKFLVQISFD